MTICILHPQNDLYSQILLLMPCDMDWFRYTECSRSILLFCRCISTSTRPWSQLLRPLNDPHGGGILWTSLSSEVDTTRLYNLEPNYNRRNIYYYHVILFSVYSWMMHGVNSVPGTCLKKSKLVTYSGEYYFWLAR